MTEEEAYGWLNARYSSGQMDRLERLAALVIAETEKQNLIAPSTIDTIWNRHILDSAQLLNLSGDTTGIWLDIGTGAGFPGLVVACLSERAMWLVEPRARRAAFLSEAVVELGLPRVSVSASKIALIDVKATTISARAVAPLASLLTQAVHCSDSKTRWLLPKGKSGREEVAHAQQTWHGSFHVEHSITDPDGLIVVASEVSRR